MAILLCTTISAHQLRRWTRQNKHRPRAERSRLALLHLSTVRAVIKVILLCINGGLVAREEWGPVDTRPVMLALILAFAYLESTFCGVSGLDKYSTSFVHFLLV